jgi:hypothetical protein
MAAVFLDRFSFIFSSFPDYLDHPAKSGFRRRVLTGFLRLWLEALNFNSPLSDPFPARTFLPLPLLE